MSFGALLFLFVCKVVMDWVPFLLCTLPKVISVGSQVRNVVDTTTWAASWVKWGLLEDSDRSAPSEDIPPPSENWQWVANEDDADYEMVRNDSKKKNE